MTTLQIIIVCLFASGTSIACTVIIAAAAESIALIKRGVIVNKKAAHS